MPDVDFVYDDTPQPEESSLFATGATGATGGPAQGPAVGDDAATVAPTSAAASAPAPSSPEASVGSSVPTIDGFRDLREIGRGGFSVVYSAHQPKFDRDVALKVLNIGGSDQRRFVRECHALGPLTGIPGIVAVLDAAVTGDGRPCIVMPLMSGGSLGDRLKRGDRFDVGTVVDWTVEIGTALQAAHDLGIHHRDVKPENILLDASDRPALSDFGIASVESVTNASQTEASLSPPYSPPERFLTGEASLPAASDVYALAATVYALLAGRPPFGTSRDGGISGLIRRVCTDDPPPIGRTDVPPAFEAALRQAMQKNAKDRQPDVGTFVADVQRATGRDITVAGHVAPVAVPTPPSTPAAAVTAPPSVPAAAVTAPPTVPAAAVTAPPTMPSSPPGSAGGAVRTDTAPVGGAAAARGGDTLFRDDVVERREVLPDAAPKRRSNVTLIAVVASAVAVMAAAAIFVFAGKDPAVRAPAVGTAADGSPSDDTPELEVDADVTPPTVKAVRRAEGNGGIWVTFEWTEGGGASLLAASQSDRENVASLPIQDGSKKGRTSEELIPAASFAPEFQPDAVYCVRAVAFTDGLKQSPQSQEVCESQ